MIRHALLPLLFACAASCTAKAPENVEIGGTCYRDVQCKSGICVSGKCRSGEAGSPCHSDGDCKGLECIAHVTRTATRRWCAASGSVGDQCKTSDDCLAGNACSVEHICESAEKQAAKEAKLLEQSGVDEAPALERSAHPAAPGRRVRVATARAEDAAFAACRKDERLVGGGCRVEPRANEVSMFEASYPSDFGPDDTVGARWQCSVPGRDITAFALCEKVPEAD